MNGLHADICVLRIGVVQAEKTIQWHKLWYHFPVVYIQSYFGERAVSFKKVSLPESLLVDVVTFGEVLHEVSYPRYE